MLTFELTIPEEKAEMILEAFAARFEYKPTILEEVVGENGEPSFKEVPNPQTTREFTRAKVIQYIRNTTQEYFTQKSLEEARVEAESQIDFSEIV